MIIPCDYFFVIGKLEYFLGYIGFQVWIWKL